MTPFEADGDVCLGFWAEAWQAGVVTFPEGAHVLEIGCAEADWLTPMKTARPDLHLTGLDWRGQIDRPGADVLLQADVLTYEFPVASFDAVVAISTIEHIGLSAYGGDPRDPEGDTHTMERIARWLRPRGFVYLDVPYRPDGTGFLADPQYRAYGPDTLVSRLVVPPLVEEWRSSLLAIGHLDGPCLSLVLRHQGANHA